MSAFAPQDNALASITLSTSSQSVAINSDRQGSVSVYIVNDSTGTMFVRGGGSSITVTASTGIPIPPGAQIMTFDLPDAGILYLAAILPTGAGTAYFVPGAGE